MSEKERVSASVDAELVETGRAAVAAGDAPDLSPWIDGAPRRQSEHDGRLRALGEFVASFEAEHGEITDEEIEEATRTSDPGDLVRLAVAAGRHVEIVPV